MHARAVLLICGFLLISSSLATPFLSYHRHPRQGLPEVLLETFANSQSSPDDTSHISDYTHQPKANSNADAPKKINSHDGPMNSNSLNFNSKPQQESAPGPLDNLGFIASTIGSLLTQAPKLLQSAVGNLPIVQQSKFFARNVESPDSDADNEISSDLTTTTVASNGDAENIDIESIESGPEEGSSEKPTPTSHAPPPPPPPTRPQHHNPPSPPPSQEESPGLLFTIINTVKSGFQLIKSVLLPAEPKHDPKAIEPPNTAFVTALENVMALLQPLLGARGGGGGNRKRRDVEDSSQERFYNLIERTVLDRFRFDSDVQALQAKIIFRESFVRYAGIDLLSELTEERIKHLVTFFKSLNQYRNHSSNPNEDGGSDNSLPLRKSENGDINFEFFEKSVNSESIFILFVEVLGTVAGLAWGTFSQFLWIISNMN